MPISNHPFSVSMFGRQLELTKPTNPTKPTKPRRSYQHHPSYPVPLPIVQSRHFGLRPSSDQYPATVAFGPFGFYNNLYQ